MVPLLSNFTANEKAPDSVNPSLWENTKNNHAYGLFEVTDGIYRANPLDSLP